MKPRNREINIFNLSMLDVISGALGAFLIIMVVLFPYYKKETIDFQKQVEQLSKQLQTISRQLEESQEQVRQAQTEAQQTQQELREAQAQLSKTFLVIYIRWSTEKQDIDLHVIDPSGAEFYWDNHKTIPDRPGELSEDSKVGPGNEVWEIFDAPPGEYRIYAQLWEPNDNNEVPTVKGRVIFRDGSQKLSEVRLTSIKTNIYMNSIFVAENGDVRIGR